MPTMTDRQTEIHQYMLEHQRTKGYPPTVREVGVEFGIKSPNGVLCSLKALVKKGWVKKTGHFSRGCVAVDPTKPEACAACGHSPANGGLAGGKSWYEIENAKTYADEEEREEVQGLALELCAATFNQAEHNDHDCWHVEDGRVKGLIGESYTLFDANAIAFYYFNAPEARQGKS